MFIFLWFLAHFVALSLPFMQEKPPSKMDNFWPSYGHFLSSQNFLCFLHFFQCRTQIKIKRVFMSGGSNQTEVILFLHVECKKNFAEMRMFRQSQQCWTGKPSFTKMQACNGDHERTHSLFH